MIELTKENIWKTEYDIKTEKNIERKNKTSKIAAIGLIALTLTLTINVILIYSFFSLLNKM